MCQSLKLVVCLYVGVWRKRRYREKWWAFLLFCDCVDEVRVLFGREQASEYRSVPLFSKC